MACLGAWLIVGAAVGYVGHRPATVVHTETRTETVTKWKTRLVQVEHVVHDKASASQATRGRVVRRHRVTTRDANGATRTTVDTVTTAGEVTLSLSRDVSATTRQATRDAAGDATRATVATRAETTSRPTWEVGAMVGLDTSARVAWGAYGRRRLFGPFWAGMWVLPSPGAAGVSLGVQW